MLRPEEYLVDYSNASVVYPLSNVTTGTVASAYPVNASHDGVIQTGVILQSTNLNVDCEDRLAPEFPGTGAVLLPHAALIADGKFDILQGGIFLVARANSEALTDNTRRRLVQFKQNSNNLFDIQKGDNSELWFRFNADGALYGSSSYGIAEGIDISQTFSVALTWDWANNEVKFYINGVLRETAPYNTKWASYNGHPNGFTMQSMAVGAHYNNAGSAGLEWDGNIIYTSLFVDDTPSGETIQKTNNALVG